MSFFETPRFPPELSYYAAGGPAHATQVVEVASGYEKRNVLWSQARCHYDISGAMKDQGGKDAVIAFFRAAQGKAHGFRFRDWADYQDKGNGLLDAGVGDGTPYYQMNKAYIQGLTATRKITKPLTVGAGAGVALVFNRNGSAMTAGASAGNYAIDTTTGVLTMVADNSSGSSAITPGATTSVVLAANPGGLVAGKLLYLGGFSGADAALVNGIAHPINSVSGSGPYTFVLATVTTGKTITVGSGTGYKYPQTSDTMTWTGEFDVPVRFDTDVLQGYQDTGLYAWGSVPLVELRL